MAARNSINTFVTVGLALACVGVWSLGEYVTENLASLQVKAVPTKKEGKDAAQPFDVKSLFPVWVASARKEHASDEATDVEGLFKEAKPEIATSAAAPAEPNYAALLGSRMSVDAIGEGGAFINGRFYRVGESIADFEYPENGKQIVPRLAEVRAKSILVIHGSHRTEIKG